MGSDLKSVDSDYFNILVCMAEKDPINIPHFLYIYKNGTILRDPWLSNQTFGQLVPPLPNDPQTGVSSKDITIIHTNNITARIYLPKLTNPSERIPILLHFHGGGFCIGSPFDRGDFLYLNQVSSQGKILVVSVNYRLFPEHQLPAAYIDAWSALKWVASQKGCGDHEPWIVNHGDFTKVFVGGDSAGGNIAHNVIVWAGKEKLPNDVKVVGAILAMPEFSGSKPLASEPKVVRWVVENLWKYECPSCEGGLDSPYLNPFGPGAPSLAQLGCQKLMVYVAEKDGITPRGVQYYEGIKASGWKGEAFLYEGKGMQHVFHTENAEHPETKKMIERVVEFINN
ncbi:hypothetical protein Ancab_022248 [Ancistrocladus abbreviatus]